MPVAAPWRVRLTEHPALELSGIGKAFGPNRIFHALSLLVRPGEYVTILGPSGAGKSTLLRIVAGFEAPDTGDIRLAGRSVLATPAHARGVGFVFQSFALFPHLSVADNVGFGLRHRRGAAPDPGTVARQVSEALRLVGLEGLGGRMPSEISGGQRQRVAFARTLVAEPRLVLLDEPLGALDARLRERMMVELRRLHERLGATFVHVTGNEQEALAMGTRVAVLTGGGIGQIDTPDALVRAPATSEVARLLNCYNVLHGAVQAGCFAADGVTLALAPGAVDGPAAYCIRSDRVEVADAATPLPPGHVRVAAKFLAGEYSGARMIGLFDVQAGRPFEVEYYLGHRQPPAFERGRDYALAWPADAALLFADR